MSKHHRKQSLQVQRPNKSVGQQSSQPDNKTQIDVCILTAGCFDLLRMSVAKAIVAMHTLPSRMLVLDNGSTNEEHFKNDDIFKMARDSKYSSERGAVKHLQQNTGFPKGANELFRMGTAPLIMYISDDVMVEEGAINQLFRRMDDPTIGLCGMKFLFPLNSTDPNRPAGKVQHIGHGVNIRGEITHPLLGWSSTNPKCNISREVFSLTGAVFMVRRKLFRQAGGFSEDYGVGTFEDVELCLRIRELGYKIYIDTNAVGYHYVGATAQLKKTSFPLLFNSMLFNSRWAQKLAWTEWEMY